jgi:hypothetical protein
VSYNHEVTMNINEARKLEKRAILMSVPLQMVQPAYPPT